MRVREQRCHSSGRTLPPQTIWISLFSFIRIYRRGVGIGIRGRMHNSGRSRSGSLSSKIIPAERAKSSNRHRGSYDDEVGPRRRQIRRRPTDDDDEEADGREYMKRRQRQQFFYFLYRIEQDFRYLCYCACSFLLHPYRTLLMKGKGGARGGG